MIERWGWVDLENLSLGFILVIYIEISSIESCQNICWHRIEI